MSASRTMHWKLALLASIALAWFAWSRGPARTHVPDGLEQGATQRTAGWRRRASASIEAGATVTRARIAELSERLWSATDSQGACEAFADLARTDAPETAGLIAQGVRERRDAEARTCGAEALARSGREDALEALRALADDEHSDVRTAALEGLARSGEPGAVEVVLDVATRGAPTRQREALVALGNAHVREGAPLIARALDNGRGADVDLVAALGHTRDPEAASTLARLIEHPDGDMVAAAFDALAALDTAESAAILSRAMTTGPLVDARFAARALAECHDPGARSALLEAAGGNGILATHAAAALVGVDGDDVHALMATLLASDDHALAAIAIQHVSSRRDVAAIPRLQELAETPAAGLASEAVMAIVSIGGEGGRSALEHLASRRGPGRTFALAALAARPETHDHAIELAIEIVRDEGGNQARRALQLLGTDARDAAREALFATAREGSSLSSNAVALLGRRRDAGSAELLVRLASDADARVRREALRALGDAASAGPEVTQLLIASTRDPAFASDAVHALGSTRSADALRVLLDLARSTETSGPLRIEALREAARQRALDPRALEQLAEDPALASEALDVLATTSPSRAEQLVTRMAASSEASVRLLAVDSMRSIRVAAAIPLLVTVLNDRDVSMATRAIEPLLALGGRDVQNALVAILTDERAERDLRTEVATALREAGGEPSRTHARLITTLTDESITDQFEMGSVCSPDAPVE